jgi:hypothetical protein
MHDSVNGVSSGIEFEGDLIFLEEDGAGPSHYGSTMQMTPHKPGRCNSNGEIAGNRRCDR